MPPYYEYKCESCDNTVVQKARVADRDEPVRCDNKVAHQKEKVYMKRSLGGRGGFVLKGSSWAKDQYGLKG